MRKDQGGLDLTSGSHFRNILTLSLPIMISNFMQTFYNLADTFWLGKLGETARASVSIAGIAFPIIFFFASFGAGLVIAGTALISRYRGAGMDDKIKELVGQFSLLVIVFASLFIVVSLLSLDSILHLLQTPTEVYEIGRQYMQVTISSIFFMFVFLAYQSICHGMGDSITPMKIQLFTLTLNVVLDPFLIFGWWIFPRYEALGAAYATFFCRFLTAVLALFFFVKKSEHFVPGLKDLKPKIKILWSILKISIPASISQSTISIGFLVLQGFVNSFGTVVISVNAIGNRMVSLFMMPAMGLSNGLAAIIGQNLGANNIERAKKSISQTFLLVMLIMVAGGLIMFFFGGQLTRFFIDDSEVIAVGNRMFRIVAVAANFFAILFVFMGVFNGAGKTATAMVFNLARFWVFRIPLVYLLSGRLFELSVFFLRIYRETAKSLGNPISEQSL
jgi:putative MATE family efflux protein